MDANLQNFIRELIVVLERHQAFLTYTTDDDGVWAGIGDERDGNAVRLGFMAHGRGSAIKQIKEQINMP